MDVDDQLRKRAKLVIPNGMYGHQSTKMIPKEFPQFFSKAQGCRVWDVNGKEYIDYMCAYGPNILGYRYPDVERAAAKQAAKGDCMVGPGEVMVQLAETLVNLTPGSDWAMFAKNGNDATCMAVTIARAATKKRYLLREPGAYHGASSIWRPGQPGVLPTDVGCQLPFKFNDLSSVEKAAQQVEGDLAAIIVSAFDYRWSVDLVMATREFAQGVRALCDRTGAILILDDVRAGFRLGLDTSWGSFGVKPDITTYSKAIANGYALSSVVGSNKVRRGAEKVFATGSFWFSAVAMAAALTTLNIMQKLDVVSHINKVGTLFCDGLRKQAKEAGLKVTVSGPPSMPFMTFFGDKPDKKGQGRPRARLFTKECVKRGIYLHPYHNWFLCYSHTEQDIEMTLRVTKDAFQKVQSVFPTFEEESKIKSRM